MDAKISWAEVQKRYGTLLAEIEQKKAASTSKSKDMPLDQCRWALSWCMEFKAESFDEVIASVGKPRPKPVLDVEAELQSKLASIPGCSLICIAGRGRWYARIDFAVLGIPDEIVAYNRKWAEEEVANRQRIEAMTPAQRRKETNSILGELMGQPGFAAIRIGKH